jgi:molecular chaperone GrpE
MVYRNATMGRSPRQQMVSLQVAERIAMERDHLAQEADSARRELDRLRLMLGREQASNTELRESSAVYEAELEQARMELGQLRAKPSRVVQEGGGADQVQRLAADLANLRRRREEDISLGVRAERVRLLGHLMGLRDSLERAVAASGGDDSAWQQGMAGILDQVDQALATEGAEPFGALGDVFDPNLHSAIGVVEVAEQPGGQVHQVVRQGARLKDGSLVRAADVVVTR